MRYTTEIQHARGGWLETLWREVRTQLPPPPAVVVELGCGALGGFVPYLGEAGYYALGIDPEAPAGPCYQRVEFERSALPGRVDATIACTSLHHVADPGAVLDAVVSRTTTDGVVVVVEWDWERFDEPTAQWAFERLGPDEEAEDGENWLCHRRAGWLASGCAWDAFLRDWATGEGLHTASRLLVELDRRFVASVCAYGPYLFSELAGVTEADEQRAIDAGTINAMRLDYVGSPRQFSVPPQHADR